MMKVFVRQRCYKMIKDFVPIHCYCLFLTASEVQKAVPVCCSVSTPFKNSISFFVFHSEVFQLLRFRSSPWTYVHNTWQSSPIKYTSLPFYRLEKGIFDSKYNFAFHFYLVWAVNISIYMDLSHTRRCALSVREWTWLGRGCKGWFEKGPKAQEKLESTIFFCQYLHCASTLIGEIRMFNICILKTENRARVLKTTSWLTDDLPLEMYVSITFLHWDWNNVLTLFGLGLFKSGGRLLCRNLKWCCRCCSGLGGTHLDWQWEMMQRCLG